MLERMDAAVRDAIGQARDVVYAVTHGTAMSLYIAEITGIDAGSFWSTLEFPDAWVVDLASRKVTRPEESTD